MPRDLCLAVRKEYFEQIDEGNKPFEYRRLNDYWINRIANKDFDTVTITLGYPPKNDQSRRIVFAWDGYTVMGIRHKEFGDAPIPVFAVSLKGKRLSGGRA